MKHRMLLGGLLSGAASVLLAELVLRGPSAALMFTLVPLLVVAAGVFAVGEPPRAVPPRMERRRGALQPPAGQRTAVRPTTGNRLVERLGDDWWPV